MAQPEASCNRSGCYDNGAEQARALSYYYFYYFYYLDCFNPELGYWLPACPQLAPSKACALAL
jgi:hypothetical protein